MAATRTRGPPGDDDLEKREEIARMLQGARQSAERSDGVIVLGVFKDMIQRAGSITGTKAVTAASRCSTC